MIKAYTLKITHFAPDLFARTPPPLPVCFEGKKKLFKKAGP